MPSTLITGQGRRRTGCVEIRLRHKTQDISRRHKANCYPHSLRGEEDGELASNTLSYRAASAWVKFQAINFIQKRKHRGEKKVRVNGPLAVKGAKLLDCGLS